MERSTLIVVFIAAVFRMLVKSFHGMSNMIKLTLSTGGGGTTNPVPGLDSMCSSNCQVINNTVQYMDQSNGYTYPPGRWGIGLEDNSWSMTISNNTIHDCIKNSCGYGGIGIGRLINCAIPVTEMPTLINNTLYNNNIDYSWNQ